MNASPLRYFLAVNLHPRHNLAALAGVTGIGLWTVAMSPGELDSALGMLLFVQMFLASTGFVTRARRGHFDPILTSASRRSAVVVSHWFASALPGVVGWAIVASVDWAYGGSAAASALMGRRLLALAIVSAITWTAGFRLSRGAAGALWAALLVAVLLRRSDLLGVVPTIGGSSSILRVLRHAAAVTMCPFLLLGAATPLAPGSIAVAGCGTAVALLSVWRAADRVDIYLRDRT
jgi:hypothetical protein